MSPLETILPCSASWAAASPPAPKPICVACSATDAARNLGTRLPARPASSAIFAAARPAPIIFPASAIDSASNAAIDKPRSSPASRAPAMNTSSASLALTCAALVRSTPSSASLDSSVAKYSVPNEPAAIVTAVRTGAKEAPPVTGAAKPAAPAASKVGPNKPNDSADRASARRGLVAYSLTASNAESVSCICCMICWSSAVSWTLLSICCCCSANSSVSLMPSDANAWKRSTPRPNGAERYLSIHDTGGW